MLRRPSI